MSQMDTTRPTCPQCHKAIQGDDINVAKDLAYCRSCNLAHRLSDIVRDSELTDGVDFNHPPKGVSLSETGMGMVITASHRSMGAAIGSLGVALFWNGIVSVFVLLATASTLTLLDISVPVWFPAPNMNGESIGLGMTLFLWIFLTPFIVIGLTMIAAFFMSIGGRTEFQINHKTGSIFTGVGPIGYRRRFDISSVSDVKIDARQWRDSDGDRRRKTCIVLATHEGRQIRFGSMLTEEKRKFLAASVRKILAP